MNYDPQKQQELEDVKQQDRQKEVKKRTSRKSCSSC